MEIFIQENKRQNELGKILLKNTKPLLCLALLTLLSCSKNNKSETVIEIDIIAKKDDVFQLFYSNNIFKNYLEKNSKIVDVHGKPNNQKISFLFSSDIEMNRIRLDFGQNKQQKSILINKIVIKKNGIAKVYHGNELNIMFDFNKNVIYDKKSKQIFLIEVDNKYDPYIVSKNLSLIK